MSLYVKDTYQIIFEPVLHPLRVTICPLIQLYNIAHWSLRRGGRRLRVDCWLRKRQGRPTIIAQQALNEVSIENKKETDPPAFFERFDYAYSRRPLMRWFRVCKRCFGNPCSRTEGNGSERRHDRKKKRLTMLHTVAPHWFFTTSLKMLGP